MGLSKVLLVEWAVYHYLHEDYGLLVYSTVLPALLVVLPALLVVLPAPLLPLYILLAVVLGIMKTTTRTTYIQV